MLSLTGLATAANLAIFSTKQLRSMQSIKYVDAPNPHMVKKSGKEALHKGCNVRARRVTFNMPDSYIDAQYDSIIVKVKQGRTGWSGVLVKKKPSPVEIMDLEAGIRNLLKGVRGFELIDCQNWIDTERPNLIRLSLVFMKK